jgi:AraC-like DNA-binding protein
MYVALILSGALGKLPEVVRAETGERGLQRAFDHAHLPHRLVENQSLYITEASLYAFVEAAARQMGDGQFGLVAAPHLTTRSFGLWGQYVHMAPTLGDALRRTVAVSGSFGSHLRIWLRRNGDNLRFSARMGRAGAEMHENIGYCALGNMTGLVRDYLGPRWRPREVWMDIPRRASLTRIEDTFGGRAHLGAPEVSFNIPLHLLSTPRPQHRREPQVTLADVLRALHGGTPAGLPEIVTALVRVQVMEGAPGLEGVAESLNTGPRSLQRELERQGTTFRDLALKVRIERARELLAEPDITVTQAAIDLGYSSPAHFARAFMRETGINPTTFRRQLALPRPAAYPGS